MEGCGAGGYVKLRGSVIDFRLRFVIASGREAAYAEGGMIGKESSMTCRVLIFILLLGLPALAQSNVILSGRQIRGTGGRNGQLLSKPITLTVAGTVVDVACGGDGFWIEGPRGTVKRFPAAHSALGYVLSAGGPYRLYPNLRPHQRETSASITLKPGKLPRRLANGALIRQRGNQAVYVIENGERRLIPNPETFNARGYSWGAVKEIGPEEMGSVPEGRAIPSALNSTRRFADGALIRQRGTQAVYVIENGERRLIPNPETFNARGYTWGAVKEVSPEEMGSVPAGRAIPSVK